MLSVKRGSIKYHFLRLWYGLTGHWTQVSRSIGEHSNRLSLAAQNNAIRSNNIQAKIKNAQLLYNVPMNINWSIPILIYTLDTIIRVGNMVSSSLQAVGHLLHDTSEYCILLML